MSCAIVIRECAFCCCCMLAHNTFIVLPYRANSMISCRYERSPRIQRKLCGIPRMPEQDGLDHAACEAPCKRQACAIQFCLQQRGYQESRCSAVIERYYDCCRAVTAAKREADSSR